MPNRDTFYFGAFGCVLGSMLGAEFGWSVPPIVAFTLAMIIYLEK